MTAGRGKARGWGRGWRALTTLLAIPGTVALFVLFTPLTNLLARPLVTEGRVARAEAIVVLGGGVLGDGSPSDASLRRARYGARLFKQGYAPLLIFSTGTTAPGVASEARAMAEVAFDMGIGASAVILEERSTRTAENAAEVVRILKARNVPTALLVTHPTHMGRALAAFRRAGMEMSAAPTDGREDTGTNALERAVLFFRVGHEYGAWVLYWWKGWV